MYSDDNRFQVLLIGRGGVGKSALAIQWVNCHFVDEYDPTITEDYYKNIVVDEKGYAISTWEHSTDWEDYTALRDQAIRYSKAFLLMFSITSRDSFAEIQEILARIGNVLNREREEFPAILVGGKCDLDQNREVSRETAQAFADKNKMRYIETSARQRINVDEVFQEIVREKNRVEAELERRKNPPPKKSWNSLHFNLFKNSNNSKKKEEKMKKREDKRRQQQEQIKIKEAQLKKWNELKVLPEIHLPASSYVSDLRGWVNDDRFSDLKFIIAEGYSGEGQTIHGHLCILLSHFSNIFETLEKQGTIPRQPALRADQPRAVPSNSWKDLLKGIELPSPRLDEIAKIFSDNSLSQSDIGDFDHELLSSMGISNAKERLTILKWVKQHIGEKEEKKKEERKEKDKEKEKEREKEPEKQNNVAPETTVYLVKADFDLFIFILEYIYSGELNVNIPDNRLDDLCKTASRLHVYPMVPILKARIGKQLPPADTFSVKGGQNSLLASGLYSDITFIVNSKSIAAHKAFLGSRSQYFRNMFCAGLKESHQDEIDLSVTSPAAFTALLQYFYCDVEKIESEVVMEVFFLSHMYELSRLVSICEQTICSLMDESNCLEILDVAEQLDREELKKVCHHFIAFHFDGIQSRKQWKKLGKEKKDSLSLLQKNPADM